MQVVTIKDIVRKDVPIYYRLLYTGVAVLDLSKGKGPEDYRIDFSIEIKPTGQKEVVVSFLTNLDYPLVPVVKELKKIIDQLHSNGGLPD